MTENVADFSTERDVVPVFVMKENPPAGRPARWHRVDRAGVAGEGRSELAAGGHVAQPHGTVSVAVSGGPALMAAAASWKMENQEAVACRIRP